MLEKYILNALNLMPERFNNIEKQITQTQYYYEFNTIMNELLKKNLDEILERNKIKNINVKIYVAKGRAAYIPWIGFHYLKNNIDSTPQTGIYVTILFKADGSGVYLSLQNGTEKNTQTEVAIKTESLKLKYKELINKANIFSQNKLNLKGQFFAKKMSRCEKYEKASILCKQYDKEQLNNNILEKDLITMINFYKYFLDNGMNNKNLNITSEKNYQLIELDLPDTKFKTIKDKSPEKRKIEKELECSSNKKTNDLIRSTIEGQVALQNANFKCEFDPNHITFLKPNNHKFMEKHHLIPMKYYNEFENNIDDHNNIYSLCPICHSQIHYGKNKDQKKIIEKLFEQRKEQYRKYYNIDIKKLLELYGIID